MKQANMSRKKFLWTYITAMVTPFFLRYFFFMSMLVLSNEDGSNLNNSLITLVGIFVVFVQAVTYLVMIYTSFKRGQVVNRAYLWIFPFIAAGFALIGPQPIAATSQALDISSFGFAYAVSLLLILLHIAPIVLGYNVRKPKGQSRKAKKSGNK